jgi:hypothetical protein
VSAYASDFGQVGIHALNEPGCFEPQQHSGSANGGDSHLPGLVPSSAVI